jgi:hypothetical protein
VGRGGEGVGDAGWESRGMEDIEEEGKEREKRREERRGGVV